ncbi:MAG: aminotransferase class IV [Sulfurospirillum sp.]|nr:aminotransferase class IV [Sulfurospirillum sp.]
MFPCFETLLVQNFTIANLTYHQKRCDKTRRELYGTHKPLKLESLLHVNDAKIYRAKVIYAKECLHVSTSLYENTRIFESFTLQESDFIYPYKYLERKKLDGYGKDILFHKNSILQDTNIANIALFIDGVWMTPKEPLLEGTIRARLLDEGFLRVEKLDTHCLKIAEKFAIMNALLGFKIIENVRIVY